MGGFGSSTGHRPHKRRRTRRGGSGMKGYSRYGSLGKGLSDQAQHVYNTAKRATLTSGVDRAMFDREVMTFRLDGQDVFRGLYNIPGAPQYAGGEYNYAALTPPQQVRVMGALHKEKGIGISQFGSITTGRGKGRNRGYPPWVTKMLGKANAPDQDTASSILPLGLGILVLKVLI